MPGRRQFLHDLGGRVFGHSYYRNVIRAKLGYYPKCDPILVWHMGKVGSSTILNSLHQAHLGSAVFHVHLLNDALLRKGELFRKSLRRGSKGYLYNSALREHLLNGRHHWKIISLVRDPVGRNISSFFQNLDLYAPDIAPNDASRVDLLRQIFFDEFDHERPLYWFEHEIKELLGIDVFSRPFPTDKGYVEYSTDRFDLLVLRMEDLNTTGVQALRHFLSAPKIELTKANVGADKAYATLYTQLRRQIGLPADYLERMYGSKYSRHFYTPEEIKSFRMHWEEAYA